MALETAEEFANKLAKEARVERPWGQEWVRQNVIALIEADRDAVRREVLEEIRGLGGILYPCGGEWLRRHENMTAALLEKYATKNQEPKDA